VPICLTRQRPSYRIFHLDLQDQKYERGRLSESFVIWTARDELKENRRAIRRWKEHLISLLDVARVHDALLHRIKLWIERVYRCLIFRMIYHGLRMFQWLFIWLFINRSNPPCVDTVVARITYTRYTLIKCSLRSAQGINCSKQLVRIFEAYHGLFLCKEYIHEFLWTYHAGQRKSWVCAQLSICVLAVSERRAVLVPVEGFNSRELMR